MAAKRGGRELRRVEEVFFCDCGSPEHQFILAYDRDEPDVAYLHAHLGSPGFWRRVVTGIKYIFGHRSEFGEFDEVVIDIEDARRMSHVLRLFTMDNAVHELKE